MLCKTLAPVARALLPCGRGCLHYYPMGLFLASPPCLSTRPAPLPPTGPGGPPHPLASSSSPVGAGPLTLTGRPATAGGLTPRERRLRPLTRRSLPSAPDLFLGSSGSVRWAPSCPERPYQTPWLCHSIHSIHPVLPTRLLPSRHSLRARAPGNAFSSPSARSSYRPTAELAGASAQAQN